MILFMFVYAGLRVLCLLVLVSVFGTVCCSWCWFVLWLLGGFVCCVCVVLFVRMVGLFCVCLFVWYGLF